jgi:hypothetical protein
MSISEHYMYCTDNAYDIVNCDQNIIDEDLDKELTMSEIIKGIFSQNISTNCGADSIVAEITESF